MAENTVVGKLLTGGNPQLISREIVATLAERRKFGYHAIFEEAVDPAGEMTITFTFGQAEQPITIPYFAWTKTGGIRNAILGQLRSERGARSVRTVACSSATLLLSSTVVDVTRSPTAFT
jgi:hypothetical protein